MKLNVVVDSSIKFNPNDIPKNVLNEILGRLKIPNPQKKLADKEMLWNAKNIPEFVELWKFNSYNELVLPRGFIFEFEKLLKDNNIKVYFENRMIKDDKCGYQKNINPIDLRDYQDIALSELFTYGSGVYCAPTGAGKTITMLELIRCCGQKTLVICEKLDIAKQWAESARKYEFNVGLISDEDWSVGKDLIIALRQTILSRVNKLDSFNWFNKFGCIVYDEMHHLSAPTAFELLGRFPAYYRFGCSATPDSDEDLFPIARAVIGPIVAESVPDEIGDHLVIPSVKVVKTEFEFDYRPTVRLGKKVVRNNYNNMVDSLINDSHRNSEIAYLIRQEALKGNHCLVVSDRKNHLDNIFNYYFISENICKPKIKWFKLTGDNSDESIEIKKQIENSDIGTVTFSTLAEEGTDIPRLDRLFLAYPGRKLRGFEQAIGRIMRPHPMKKDAIVYDFRDYKVPLLNSQFRDRNQRIYHKKGYKVEQ